MRRRIPCCSRLRALTPPPPSFLLFCSISLPLVYVPPEFYRKPFLYAAAISTLACFSIFIWSLARAGGGGPLIGGEAFELIGVEQAKGADLGWACVCDPLPWRVANSGVD